MAHSNLERTSSSSTDINAHSFYSNTTEKIVSSFNKVVEMLAQNLFASNGTTPNFCRQIVGNYLKENPDHRDLAELTCRNLHGVLQINFYDLTCRIEPNRVTYNTKQWVPEFGDTVLHLNAELRRDKSTENRYAYIPECRRVSQVWSKTTSSDGEAITRHYAYIPELGTMDLVKEVQEKIGKTPQLDVWKFDPTTQTMLKRSFEKHEYSNKLEEGFFQHVSGLQPQCRYLVDGKREVTNSNGDIDFYEGRFGFVGAQNKNNTHLVQGTIRQLQAKQTAKGKFTETLTAEGAFVFYDAIQKMRLSDGKLTKSAYTDDGQWAYVQAHGTVVLIDGTRTYPDGRVETGRREYIFALKRMELVEGVKKDSDGTRQCGFWFYHPGLRDMVFTCPTFTTPSGIQEKGYRPYFPELNDFALKEGTRILPDGTRMTGSFEFVPECGFKNTQLLHGRIDYPVSDNAQAGHSKATPKHAFCEGDFAYIPELHQMRLTHTEQVLDGQTQEIAWIYSVKEKDMVLFDLMTHSNKKALQDIVKNLGTIAAGLDPQAKTHSAFNLLGQTLAYTLQAKTLEEVELGLHEVGAKMESLLNQLIPLCFSDGIHLDPAHEVVYIHLKNLKNDMYGLLNLVR